ncbi:glutamate-cysteine ligase family protein [Desulfurivibrio sp. D14AmB]|uniref:carboxylate-amine ligase n=1 Tax=Desulfurivibrio sp. D14AmB TaxID=3374370 RepID=UPI00376F3B2A
MPKSNPPPPLRLFAAVGIELEYMIVAADSFEVRPLADQVLHAVTDNYQGEFEKPGISWSNELALHVIELKTTRPATDLVRANGEFQQDIGRINEILSHHRARLLPGGAHPWMDPFREIKLWPHDHNIIYENYNRIFDCRGHGWANLQSCHINLPFAGDEEFGRLHAAIRVLLPLIPALSASTPVLEGVIQPSLDQRLEYYKTNSARVPSLTGAVIPEPVFSQSAYRREILQRIYDDIAPLDPDGVLRDEWLNARGAIARFDRNAIEIRIIDIQECPAADLAIAALLVATLKELVAETFATGARQRQWATTDLAAIFNRVVRAADQTVIDHQDYLELFGLGGSGPMGAGECWRRLLARHRQNHAIAPEHLPVLDTIIGQGCLARRMLRFLESDSSRPRLTELNRRLCRCLEQGRNFIP